MTENVTPEQYLAAIEAEEARLDDRIGLATKSIAVMRTEIARHRERLRELARMKPRKPRAKKTD